jgi:hypothetical protein
MSGRNGQAADLEDQAADIEDQAAELVEGPTVLEYGRYRVFEAPDGGWVVARAVDTCETCQACGCGDQADPIQIPAMVIRMAKAQGPGLFGKLRAMRGAAAGG